MRENSGKGDSNTGLLDPTVKEREEEKGRSGQAPLDPHHRTSKQRTSQPNNRGGGAR